MIRFNCSGVVFAVMAVSSATAYGEQVFFAREFLYTNEFKMGRDLFPEGSSMALSPRGIFVAGTFYLPSTLVGAAVPEPRAYIRAYDTSGIERWTREIAEATVAFTSLMTADATSLYVTGSLGYGHTELFLRKYDEAGNELWSRRVRIPEGVYHVATGLAVDASGIYLSARDGYGFASGVLRKYSPAGEELWSRTIREFNVGSVASHAGGIYVAGWADSTNGFVRKYTAGGEELWTRQIDAGQVCACRTPPGSLVANSTGVYIAGATLIKIDPSGNTLWKRPFAGPHRGDAGISGRLIYYIGGGALDEAGLYVAGETGAALFGQCQAGHGDVFVRKYSAATGDEQWTRQFGTSGNEFLGGVAADSSGVYVSGGIRGGRMHGNIFVTKLGKTEPVDYYTRPHIFQECVVNAASYVGGGIAPGEIVTIFGQNIGPAALTRLRLGDDGRLATTLADTRVLFNGIAAPLLYVSETQSSAIVPYSVAEKSTVTVEIETLGRRSEPLTLPVERSRPGVFTIDGSGYGQGAILNADGSLNSAANPAERGSIVAVYLTGEGLTDPVSVDGTIIGATLPTPRLPVSVWFEDPRTGDGDSAEVVYAGAVPGSVAGLLQVNLRVPIWARSGSLVPFYVQIGSETAQPGFTVALR
jgi:uncharacterized protein (TIGR03437 family)